MIQKDYYITFKILSDATRINKVANNLISRVTYTCTIRLTGDCSKGYRKDTYTLCIISTLDIFQPGRTTQQVGSLSLSLRNERCPTVFVPIPEFMSARCSPLFPPHTVTSVRLRDLRCTRAPTTSAMHVLVHPA